MRREKLPGRSYYAAKPLKGGGGKKKKRAKVGVLNATLEFYFGCFFSCKTDYGAGCNTKDCQCITSYSHPKLNRAQDGVHSGILGRRCDCGLNNSQAVKHGGEGEGEGGWAMERGYIYLLSLTCI